MTGWCQAVREYEKGQGAGPVGKGTNSKRGGQSGKMVRSEHEDQEAIEVLLA